MTTRRELITLLGGAAAGLPVVAHTQQPSMPVIGFLGSATAKQWAPLMGAFLEGLSEAEIVVGRDVTIEYRWAEGQYDRLPALAASLVQRQVSVIAALTTPSAVAAKAATGGDKMINSRVQQEYVRLSERIPISQLKRRFAHEGTSKNSPYSPHTTNCLRMIPLRSRSDSFTFTAVLSAIASDGNFSRCPQNNLYSWRRLSHLRYGIQKCISI